jgi:hypothetical protein
VSPVTLVTIIAFATLTRALVYFADRSLIIDEAFVALNLERRSTGGLTGELDWNQAAPIGFLEIEKALSTLFGNSEYVLRAAPFVASLVALLLFAKVALSFVESYAIPLAVLLFAGIALVTSYAAIAKPYSFDVGVALALYLFTIIALDDEKISSSVLLAAAGVIAPLFSYASVFVIAASATVLMIDAVMSKNRRKLIQRSFTIGTWLIFLSVVYVSHSSTLSHLRRSLSTETIRSIGSARNAAANLRQVLGVSEVSGILGYGNGLGATFSLAATLCAALLITVGAVRLVKRDWRRGALLLLPGFGAVGASALGWYPIFPRTLLFFAPALAILAAEGFRTLFGWSRSAAVRSVVIGLLALLIIAETASTVHGIEIVRPDDGIKPIMRILADHQRAGDTVYLDFASQYAFAHYLGCRCAGSQVSRAARERLWKVSPVPGSARQWAPALESRTPRFRIGEFQGYGLRGYYRDFARLPGHGRVWVILSGLNPEQRRAIEGRLKKRGKRLMAYHDTGGVTTVSLFLYSF